jgi:pyrimidine oxygenase
MLDELAAVPGVRGVMVTFDDFVIGMEQFGTRIQPLMRSRADLACQPSGCQPGEKTPTFR